MGENEAAADIDSAAAAWVARLASGNAVPEERGALETWLDKSERHRGAYVRARAAWLLLSPLESAGLVAATDESGVAEIGMAGPRTSRRGLIAAGIAAVVTTSLGLYATRAAVTRVGTLEGEQRRLPLGPGRSVLLNTQSTVAMKCASGGCGQVDLLKGEALFSLAADAALPLVVECRDAIIKSMSATFMVALGQIDTRITVIRGVVHLVGEGSQAFSIDAGKQAIVAGGQATVRAMGSDELGRTIAWSTGHLVFSGETISEAAAMMNRYNRLKVGIGRGVPWQEALVGRFSINDPRGFADAVASIYGLSVRPEGDTLVLEAR